jgi:hypothetical protein
VIDDNVSNASRARIMDGHNGSEVTEPVLHPEASLDAKSAADTVSKPAAGDAGEESREPPPLRDLARDADASARDPAVREAYRASLRDRFREPVRDDRREAIHDLVRDLATRRDARQAAVAAEAAATAAPGSAPSMVRAAELPETITVRNSGLRPLIAVIVILGLIGAGLMAWQLNVLQNQMADLHTAIAQSEKIADATSRLSDAATQSNEIATQSMTSATRPWVGVEAVEASTIQANQPLTMEVRVRNSGRTPSTDVQGLFLVYISPLDNPPALLADQCPSCVRSVLLPNGVVSYKLSVRGSVMTADQVQRIKDGKDTMWIVGRLDYHDGEGEAHTTRSCLYYRTSGIPAFTACADGNSAN